MRCTVNAEYRFKMRLVLWTVSLIFLHVAYTSGNYFEDFRVTNYDDIQDHVDSLFYTQTEAYVKIRKPRYLGHNMKQNHAGKNEDVDQKGYYNEKNPIRHAHRNHPHKNRNPYENRDNQYEAEKAEKERSKSNNDHSNRPHVDENPIDDIYERMQGDSVPLSPASQSKMQSYGTEQKVNEKFMDMYGKLPNSANMSTTTVSTTTASTTRVSSTTISSTTAWTTNITTKSTTTPDPRQDAADDHYKEMRKRTLCKSPTQIVVRVDKVYPDVRKTYKPSCTIIHQCSDDSGCCQWDYQRCAPGGTENVSLPFIVFMQKDTKPHIETLSFINHTDCVCVPKESGSDRRARRAPPETTTRVPEIFYSAGLKGCQLPCPFPFSPFKLSDGTCICECSHNSNNEELCLQHKRGEITFKYQDKLSLHLNQSIHPSCAFGKYSTRRGRCPKLHERP